MHGANLVKELKELVPDLRFCGMGSQALAGQGVKLLYDSARLAVVGLAEVIGHLRDIKKAHQTLLDEMRDNRPDLLILIDFPDFNFSLAKKAKAAGIPILYYISPQVWAWRSGRVKTIAALVDRIAVILPFEKDFYQQRGVEVDFVGHPLMDTVQTSMKAPEFREKHKLPKRARLIGILPGSRTKEVRAILPVFLEAAAMLQAGHDDLVFLLPLAPSLDRADLECPELHYANIDLRIIEGERYELMANCDLVMAASGTVTLELAILGTPMVVAYRISALTYLLGRSLIKVAYASLVNLVADRQVVTELLQKKCTATKIRAALEDIWPGSSNHQQMIKDLAQVASLLGEAGASKRTAQIALKIITDNLGPTAPSASL